MAVAAHAAWLATGWLGYAPSTPFGGVDVPLSRLRLTTLLLGGRFAAGQVVASFDRSLQTGLGVAAFVVLLAVLLRGRRNLAIAVYAVTQLVAAGGTGLDTFITAVIVIAASTAMLLRLGLLPWMIGVAVFRLLTIVPLTLDSSVPYAFTSYLIVAAVLALAIYGVHTGLARGHEFWYPHAKQA